MIWTDPEEWVENRLNDEIKGEVKMARHRNIPKLGGYWKAAIATVGTAATAIVTLSADENVRAAVGQSGVGYLAVAGVFLTGALTFLKRNQQSVDQIDKAIDDLPLEEVEDLVRKYGKKTPNFDVIPVYPPADGTGRNIGDPTL